MQKKFPISSIYIRVGMVKKFTSKKKFGTFAGLLVKLLPAKMVKMVKISS